MNEMAQPTLENEKPKKSAKKIFINFMLSGGWLLALIGIGVIAVYLDNVFR